MLVDIFLYFNFSKFILNLVALEIIQGVKIETYTYFHVSSWNIL